MNRGREDPKHPSTRSWWAWLVTPVAESSRLRLFLWVVPGESPLKTWLSAMAMLAIILLTFTPMLRYLGRPDLTFQAVCCALVLAAVIKVSGKLRTQWWFWATMIPVALTHVLFILRVPWPKWVPAGILIGFAAVDLLMIFYLISFVAKLMGKEALAKDSFAGDNSAGKSS